MQSRVISELHFTNVWLFKYVVSFRPPRNVSTGCSNRQTDRQMDRRKVERMFIYEKNVSTVSKLCSNNPHTVGNCVHRNRIMFSLIKYFWFCPKWLVNMIVKQPTHYWLDIVSVSCRRNNKCNVTLGSRTRRLCFSEVTNDSWKSFAEKVKYFVNYFERKYNEKIFF